MFTTVKHPMHAIMYILYTYTHDNNIAMGLFTGVVFVKGKTHNLLF